MFSTMNPINPVIGDLSAVRRGLIGREVDERSRIQHHLFFVCDYLSQAIPKHLNSSQRSNRIQVISVLRNYVRRGEFPVHNQSSTPLRTPRFIDHRGVHCAVGELVRQTADPKWAEQINDDFEHARIEQIESKTLQQWATASGLSLLDCAMIQPMYVPPISDLCPMMMLARDSSLETKLDIVRAFRDEHLRHSVGGRWMVRYYYKSGPKVVGFMHAQKWSQVPARKLLSMLIDTLEERC